MKQWYVYQIIDPRTGKPFYIGCSASPKKRLIGHKYGIASSAWPICVELRDLGLKPLLEILSSHTEKDEAIIAEYDLISSTDGLCNANKTEPWISWVRKHPEYA